MRFIESKDCLGVKSVKIVKKNGLSQGFGFIECMDEESMKSVIRNCQ